VSKLFSFGGKVQSTPIERDGACKYDCAYYQINIQINIDDPLTSSEAVLTTTGGRAQRVYYGRKLHESPRGCDH
jgi:hypothetical protein